MYRLLIVDDEPHVADSLYNLFSSVEHLSLDVYKAYSSKSALDWMNRTRIDIVLTDIQMPKMNGIEMMKVIRTKWPECKIIFLTGYNEFEYAYDAIQNKISGYILKTESNQEILKIVEKVMDQIDESHQIEALVSQSRNQIQQALSLMKKEFANELVGGLYTTDYDIQLQLDRLNIPISASRPFIMLLGRIDSLSCKTLPGRKNEIFFLVNTAMERFICSSMDYLFTPLESYNLLWLFQPLEKLEQDNSEASDPFFWDQATVFIRDTLEIVQTSVRESLNQTVSFVVSSEPVYWENISAKYGLLNGILDMCNDTEVLLTDKSFKYIYFQSNPQESLAIGNLYRKLSGSEKLENFLERGQSEEFLTLLEEAKNCLKTIRSLNYNPAIEIYYCIALKLLSYINRQNLRECIFSSVALNKLMRLEEHQSWDDAFNYLYQIAEAIFEIQLGHINKMEEDVIWRLKQYIEKHLNDDLSRVHLAEIVYFNPSYLSRFFKQRTGINLTDYIFNAKIDKAKKLLGDKHVKIHEVAAAVGFESSTYFARFFRRMTGLNPQEYRDKVQTCNEM